MMVNVPASCNSCSRQHYRPATTATAAAPTTLPSSCITMAAVSSACRDNVMSLETGHVDVHHCCRTRARHGAGCRMPTGGNCSMKPGINENGTGRNINLHLYNTIERPASAFYHQMLHTAASRWTKAGNMDFNYSSVQEHGKQEEALAATSLPNVGHIHLLDHLLQTAAFSIDIYDKALSYINKNKVNQDDRDGDRFTISSNQHAPIPHGCLSSIPLAGTNFKLRYRTEPTITSSASDICFPELRTGHYTCVSGRKEHYHEQNLLNRSRKHRQHRRTPGDPEAEKEGDHWRRDHHTFRGHRSSSGHGASGKLTLTDQRLTVLSKHKDRRGFTELRMLLTFMCLTVLFPFPVISATSDLTEYCESENFSPTCGRQEVVLMEHAMYGRMSLGKCVETDYGYVGCQAEVLTHMDAMCSGRRSCNLRIPDQVLDVTRPCPKEFKTFLQAKYNCVRVESAACQMCQMNNYAKLTSQSGYIGSVVTQESRVRCGSARCPWLIEVRPGQRINITLWDFALEGGTDQQNFVTDTCFRYAVIKDKAASTISTPVCGGRTRITHAYLSKKNSVEIHIVSPEVFGKRGMFMFHYEAVGCETIKPPANMWVNQKDNTAKLGCLSNSQTWEQTCEGTTWVGDIGSCPEGTYRTGASIDDMGSALTLPLGVLIAIIIGIALIIGVLILTVGLVCLKSYISSRQRPPQPRREETYMYGRSRRYSDFRDEPTAATPLQPGKENPSMGTLPLVKQHSYRQTHPHAGLPPNIRENVYMESRPLPSIPDLNEVDNDDAKSDRSSQNKVQVYRTSSGKEHYHNPRLVVNMRSDRSDRSDHSDPRGPSEDPQYFVLDPDEVSTGNPGSPLPGSSVACSASPHHPHHPQQYRGGSGGVACNKQKSPEEENAENFNKEVASTNSSLPELPPRPVTGLPRQMSQRVQSNPNDYSQGNSNCSWP